MLENLSESVEIRIPKALIFSGGSYYDLAALGFSDVIFLHGGIELISSFC